MVCVCIFIYKIYSIVKDIQTVNINSRCFSLSPLYQTDFIFFHVALKQGVYDRQNITRRLVKAELVSAYLHARTDRRLGRNEWMCGER